MQISPGSPVPSSSASSVQSDTQNSAPQGWNNGLAQDTVSFSGPGGAAATRSEGFFARLMRRFNGQGTKGEKPVNGRGQNNSWGWIPWVTGVSVLLGGGLLAKRLGVFGAAVTPTPAAKPGAKAIVAAVGSTGVGLAALFAGFKTGFWRRLGGTLGKGESAAGKAGDDLAQGTEKVVENKPEASGEGLPDPGTTNVSGGQTAPPIVTHQEPPPAEPIIPTVESSASVTQPAVTQPIAEPIPPPAEPTVPTVESSASVTQPAVTQPIAEPIPPPPGQNPVVGVEQPVAPAAQGIEAETPDAVEKSTTTVSEEALNPPPPQEPAKPKGILKNPKADPNAQQSPGIDAQDEAAKPIPRKNQVSFEEPKKEDVQLPLPGPSGMGTGSTSLVTGNPVPNPAQEGLGLQPLGGLDSTGFQHPAVPSGTTTLPTKEGKPVSEVSESKPVLGFNAKPEPEDAEAAFAISPQEATAAEKASSTQGKEKAPQPQSPETSVHGQYEDLGRPAASNLPVASNLNDYFSADVFGSSPKLDLSPTGSTSESGARVIEKAGATTGTTTPKFGATANPGDLLKIPVDLASFGSSAGTVRRTVAPTGVGSSQPAQTAIDAYREGPPRPFKPAALERRSNKPVRVAEGVETSRPLLTTQRPQRTERKPQDTAAHLAEKTKDNGSFWSRLGVNRETFGITQKSWHNPREWADLQTRQPELETNVRQAINKKLKGEGGSAKAYPIDGFPGLLLRAGRNTTSLPEGFRIIPVRQKLQALAEHDEAGITVAALIPKGHEHYNAKYLLPHQLGKADESGKLATIVREMTGESLKTGQFATHAKDFRSMSGLQGQRVVDPETNQMFTALESEILNLPGNTRYLDPSNNRYGTILHFAGQDFGVTRKTPLGKKQFTASPEKQAQSWARHKAFSNKLIEDVEQLGRLEQNTYDEAVKTLKLFEDADTALDFQHRMNVFYNAKTKRFEFIDLITEAGAGNSRLWTKGSDLDGFVDVLLAKNGFRNQARSRYVFLPDHRDRLRTEIEILLQKLEKAAQRNNVAWNGDNIRNREGITEADKELAETFRRIRDYSGLPSAMETTATVTQKPAVQVAAPNSNRLKRSTAKPKAPNQAFLEKYTSRKPSLLDGENPFTSEAAASMSTIKKPTVAPASKLRNSNVQTPILRKPLGQNLDNAKIYGMPDGYTWRQYLTAQRPDFILDNPGFSPKKKEEAIDFWNDMQRAYDMPVREIRLEGEAASAAVPLQAKPLRSQGEKTERLPQAVQDEATQIRINDPVTRPARNINDVLDSIQQDEQLQTWIDTIRQEKGNLKRQGKLAPTSESEAKALEESIRDSEEEVALHKTFIQEALENRQLSTEEIQQVFNHYQLNQPLPMKS